jgi:hypothetical protein
MNENEKMVIDDYGSVTDDRAKAAIQTINATIYELLDDLFDDGMTILESCALIAIINSEVRTLAAIKRLKKLAKLHEEHTDDTV